MRKHTCLIGLDAPRADEIREMIGAAIVKPTPPEIVLIDGELSVEVRGRMLPVEKVVYYGIFEDDLDFMAALALWGGAVYPNPGALMDCRLKLPCLVRALRYSRFGAPPRGYASSGAQVVVDAEHVAKWGNWHAGDNKARFSGSYVPEQPSIIEPFLPGDAVRVLVIGEQAWQIDMTGDDWLKSATHGDAAISTTVDADLLADTQAVQAGFGLDFLANDYIIAPDGTPHLLEVNHMPEVTRFPEVWEAYRDTVVNWIQGEQT